MATVPKYISQLADHIRDGLKKLGIRSQVTYEKVSGTNLYRLEVIAAKFKPLWFSERQNLVWKIADKFLTEKQNMRVIAIHTFAPNE